MRKIYVDKNSVHSHPHTLRDTIKQIKLCTQVLRDSPEITKKRMKVSYRNWTKIDQRIMVRLITWLPTEHQNVNMEKRDKKHRNYLDDIFCLSLLMLAGAYCLFLYAAISLSYLFLSSSARFSHCWNSQFCKIYY